MKLMRKVQIDLMMLFLKNILTSGNRPDLRAVVMSATIDGNKYQKYFSGVSSEIIKLVAKPNIQFKHIFLVKPANKLFKRRE